MTDDRPTHIVDEPGQRTRCGLKRKRNADLPLVLARHVQAHIDGHGLIVCDECAAGGWPT